MLSALSMIKKIGFEERNSRRGARLLGFVTPEPITIESRLRKWMSDVGNSSQRINRRSSPNFCLMNSWWRTVRAMEVLPIPPVPMRTRGVLVLTDPRISSTISSLPRNNLGAGGGNSPSVLSHRVRICSKTIGILQTCPSGGTELITPN